MWSFIERLRWKIIKKLVGKNGVIANVDIIFKNNGNVISAKNIAMWSTSIEVYDGLKIDGELTLVGNSSLKGSDMYE